MNQRAAEEMARQLLAALYAAPHHGPLVCAELPKSDMLPSGYQSLYNAMLTTGLTTGRLDYARFDASARTIRGFDEITDSSAFSLGQRRHENEASMLQHWASELSRRNRNVRFAKDLETMAKALPDSETTTEEAVARVVERAKQYIEQTKDLEHISKGIERALLRLAQWEEGETSDYLLTGWASVDDAIGGLPIAEMSVMAGMTSGFKTASLVDLTKRVAFRVEKQPSDIAIIGFSAEMSHEKLCHRLASNVSGVPASKMRPKRSGRREATGAEAAAYRKALGRVRGWPIYVNETPNPTYDQMYSQCLQIQSQKTLVLVWFDYIEKMDEDGDSEELRVSKIAQSLKALAKRLGVPVVTLSQYSRKAEAATGDLPKNYWLRYSSKIEQEANTIIHWHYPKYFVDRKFDPMKVDFWDPSEPNAIYAICGKNRDGEVKDAKIFVEPETGCFRDPRDDRWQ